MRANTRLELTDKWLHEGLVKKQDEYRLPMTNTDRAALWAILIGCAAIWYSIGLVLFGE